MKMYYEWGVETPNIQEAQVIQIDSKEDIQTLREMSAEEQIRIPYTLWGDEKVLVYDHDKNGFVDMTGILKAMAVVAKRVGVVVI